MALVRRGLDLCWDGLESCYGVVWSVIVGEASALGQDDISERRRRAGYCGL